MMIRKYKHILLSILCVALLLTGCVRTEVDVALHENGTGVITTTVAIKEDAYNTMKQSGSDPFSGRETKKVMYEDTAYISCSEKTGNLSYDELEAHLLSLRLDPSSETSPLVMKEVSINKNDGIFYNSYTFQAVTAAQDNSGKEQNLNDTYKFFINVTMPGNITQTKDGVTENNTATFEIKDLTKEHEFAVHSDSNNTGIVVGLVVVLVVLVGAMVYFAKKKG